MFEISQNYYCLHCLQEFLGGYRRGMYDHTQKIDMGEIRKIIISINVIPENIVLVMSDHTLRNLFIDLSSWSIAHKIIKDEGVKKSI